MKIYIKKPTQGAWMWINEGYRAAWEDAGYQTIEYTHLGEIKDDEYDVMAWDWDVKDQSSVDCLKKAHRAYLFAQPHNFPLPWGEHPNWSSAIRDNTLIEQINEAPNIFLWTFCDPLEEYYNLWKPLQRIPFGLDVINYRPTENKKYAFDVCYIGGWANNGFDEKKQIMLQHFAEIKKLNLRCGIFINRNISLQQEADILFNSKIAINIHDAYTRTLGINYNERTFKGLGITGFMVSDRHKLLENDFPELPMASSPMEMASLIKDNINTDLTDIKKKNRLDITNNHTYNNRISQLLAL